MLFCLFTDYYVKLNQPTIVYLFNKNKKTIRRTVPEYFNHQQRRNYCILWRNS